MFKDPSDDARPPVLAAHLFFNCECIQFLPCLRHAESVHESMISI